MPSYLSEKWLSGEVTIVTSDIVTGYPSEYAIQEHCSFMCLHIVSI
jgi:hypothetical protein